MASATMMLPVPAHVPPGRVRYFDIFRHGAATDMIEAAAQQSHGNEKIFFTPLNGGHWVVAGYDAAVAAGRDVEHFSNKPYTVPTFLDEPPLLPLFTDPPVHTAYRTVLNRIFTPASAVSMAASIRTTAQKLIGDIAKGKSCEFIGAFAELFPVSVFLDLLGLPKRNLPEYRDAVKTYLSAPELAGKARAGEWIAAQLSDVIRQRQARPADDVISKLISSEVDGRPATLDEALNMTMLLFTAGLDTVTVSMSYGIRYLAQHQDLQRQAREGGVDIGDLAEELLRRFSPAQPGRTVAADVDLDGVRLKKGGRVYVMLTAANLDSEIFADPLEVRFDRARKPHLAFNVGPHRCVGMHLARVELKIAYEEWLARIPQFRVAQGMIKSTGGHVLSIDRLWLGWD